LVVTGSATLPSNVSLTSLTVTNLTVTANQTIGGTLRVTGVGTFDTNIAVAGIGQFNNTQDSNATNNGSIVTLGGVGIAKNLVVGSAITVGAISTTTSVPALYSNNSLYASYTSPFIVSNTLFNLDVYSATAYRTAKYIAQIVDGTKVHVAEMLVFHDGTNVFITEYAIATNTGELGSFDAVLASNNVTLNFTANYTPANMQIKVVRTSITL
jgi:hypothetical protein